MSIYADLLEFKLGILDRVRRDVARLQPLARKAAEADVQIIETRCRATRRGWTCGTGESGSSPSSPWPLRARYPLLTGSNGVAASVMAARRSFVECRQPCVSRFGGRSGHPDFVTSAVSYAAIVFFALQILLGSGGTAADSTQKTIATILTHPGGGPLTVVIGLVAILVGLGQFLEAYRATFKEDLKGAEMSASELDIAVKLGRFGMFARGVIFLVIGWFLVQAGIHHDAAQVQGFGGAFLYLLGQPFGRIVLGIIALGFVALGLHSFACARWIRLMGSAA